MQLLEDRFPSKVFFLGIGGIGMSALARWFNQNGVRVGGYDLTPSPLTTALLEEGIWIHFVDEVAEVPKEFTESNKDTLVIFTPAIPSSNKHLKYFIDGGFILKKRAEVLGMICSTMKTLAVAGTHGKTTTSSLLTHLLHSAGIPTSAFLGGISANLSSNLLVSEEPLEKVRVVVEADEFDRSFMHLRPDAAILTAMDPDHLDIYGDEKEVVNSFLAFTNLLPSEATLYYASGIDIKTTAHFPSRVHARAYGYKKRLNTEFAYASDMYFSGTEMHFTYVSKNIEIKDLSWQFMGFHNIENAVAAISLALDEGVQPERIRESLKSFKGIKRRFEFIIQKESIVYIDDYAHHPSEIEALVSSVRYLYPEKKITLLFQPHLFTRTRDFANGFAEILSKVETPLLLPIYPARELPIEGVNSELLISLMPEDRKATLLQKDEIEEYFSRHTPEVLLTVGAGDIDRWVPKIEKILEKL